MARYELPTIETLRSLGEPREHAITIYAQTSPAPNERDTSFLTAKSAFNDAIHILRDKGLTTATENALREQWQRVADDPLWSQLSSSVAIFLSPGFTESFVLPNQLENQSQAGRYFDLGQLVRTITASQSAFALTLSTNGWNLWEATPTTQATPLEMSGDHGADAAEATNRPTIRDRGKLGRLVGDEGKNALQEKYAKHVGDAVRQELLTVDPNGDRPLFLFAVEPLLAMYRNLEQPRELIEVPGSPDHLTAAQIDEAIRKKLPALNAARNTARVSKIADGMSSGLFLSDLQDISRAATAGAVAKLIYEFTVDVLGTIDPATGDITRDENGYDLLSQIVVTVLANGGQVYAVRSSEITESAWNGVAVAGLRHPLS